MRDRKDFLRLTKTPAPATPPRGDVDLRYDGITQGLILRDSTGTDTQLGGGVASDPTGITGASAVTNIVSMSQAAYDALGSTDPATVYIITA